MNREQISQAEIAGRLGQQPELEHTSTGTAFTRLSVATSERWTDGGGQIREKTEWHRAVAWGSLAEEISQRYKKGDSLALVGAMRINSYKKDGAQNRTIELHVDKAEPNPHTQLSKNEARLVGVMREDAKFKVLDSGTARTTLSIATTTMANGKPREDWHSVTLWGKAAEAAQDIKTGDTISVNGSIHHRIIPGKEGPETKRSEIECRQFQVLERSVDRGQKAPAPAKDQDRAPSLPPPAEPPRARGRQRGKGVERGM
jgi:single-strand DNA-binding protein